MLWNITDLFNVPALWLGGLLEPTELENFMYVNTH